MVRIHFGLKEILRCAPTTWRLDTVEKNLSLLPETSTSEAAVTAERIRGAVQALKIPAYPESITISLGVSTWSQTESTDQFLGPSRPGALHSKGDGPESHGSCMRSLFR